MTDPALRKASRPSRFTAVANVLFAQLSVAVVTAGSFVVTPAVLHGLGDAAYGGWLLINSFIGYMRLVDLGTTSGTIKYGAGAEERGDLEDLRRVMNTSTAMFLGIATLTMLLTAVFAWALPRAYPTVIGDAGDTILILGGAFALEFAFRPYASALRIRSYYWIHDVFEIGSYAVFKLGLLLWFAYRKELDYRTLALLTLGDTLARLSLVTVASLLLHPIARQINPFRAARSMVRKLATMGASVSILQIADILRFQIDAAVIGYLLHEVPEGIAIFGVGSRLTSIAYFVIGTVSAVLVPRFSGLEETNDKQGTLALLGRANLLTGIFAAFLLVNLAVIGPEFLALWLHKPWVDQSAKLMVVMIPGYFVMSLSSPSAVMLLAHNKLRRLTMLNVSEAIVNLVLSVALVRPFGLWGIALGTSVPLVLFRGVLFPMMLEKDVGIGLSAYWRQHLTAVVLAAVYLVFAFGFSFVSFSGYPHFLLVCAASTAVFLVIGAVAVAAVPDLRSVVRAWLDGRRRGRRPQRSEPPPREPEVTEHLGADTASAEPSADR